MKITISKRKMKGAMIVERAKTLSVKLPNPKGTRILIMNVEDLTLYFKINEVKNGRQQNKKKVRR